MTFHSDNVEHGMTPEQEFKQIIAFKENLIKDHIDLIKKLDERIEYLLDKP